MQSDKLAFDKAAFEVEGWSSMRGLTKPWQKQKKLPSEREIMTQKLENG